MFLRINTPRKKVFFGLILIILFFYFLSNDTLDNKAITGVCLLIMIGATMAIFYFHDYK